MPALAELRVNGASVREGAGSRSCKYASWPICKLVNRFALVKVLADRDTSAYGDTGAVELLDVPSASWWTCELVDVLAGGRARRWTR